jgi:thiamine pyrophosphate-dependent acetolactate synthase large subunit-like protein
MFHIAELETAVRKNLPVIVIVAVDHAWGIEVASYKANFGADTPTPEAKWGSQVRLDKTAESFGAHGEYVTRAEDIAPAVERALARARRPWSTSKSMPKPTVSSPTSPASSNSAHGTVRRAITSALSAVPPRPQQAARSGRKRLLRPFPLPSVA